MLSSVVEGRGDLRSRRVGGRLRSVSPSSAGPSTVTSITGPTVVSVLQEQREGDIEARERERVTEGEREKDGERQKESKLKQIARDTQKGKQTDTESDRSERERQRGFQL